MFVLRRSAFIITALLTSACVYNDQFDNRTSRFDIAAAQLCDAMILTNVIRASPVTQLIALNTSIIDIPVSPTVRILQ